MMNAVSDTEVDGHIKSQLAEFRGLSYSAVQDLPVASGHEVVIKGRSCSLTTFVQKLPSGELLVTVQIARRRFVGMASTHTESGLVFGAQGSVREATAEELRNGGG